MEYSLAVSMLCLLSLFSDITKINLMKHTWVRESKRDRDTEI